MDCSSINGKDPFGAFSHTLARHNMTRNRTYITSRLGLGVLGHSREEKLPSSLVVQTAIDLMRKEVDQQPNLPFESLRQFVGNLSTFISNSEEFDASKKESFDQQLADEVNKACSALNEVKLFDALSEERRLLELGNQNDIIARAKSIVKSVPLNGGLTGKDLFFLEQSLRLLHDERYEVVEISLSCFAWLYQMLTHESFLSSTQLLKLQPDGKCEMQWHKLEDLTPEMLAISTCIFRADRQGALLEYVKELRRDEKTLERETRRMLDAVKKLLVINAADNFALQMQEKTSSHEQNRHKPVYFADTTKEIKTLFSRLTELKESLNASSYTKKRKSAEALIATLQSLAAKWNKEVCALEPLYDKMYEIVVRANYDRREPRIKLQDGGTLCLLRISEIDSALFIERVKKDLLSYEETAFSDVYFEKRVIHHLFAPAEKPQAEPQKQPQQLPKIPAPEATEALTQKMADLIISKNANNRGNRSSKAAGRRSPPQVAQTILESAKLEPIEPKVAEIKGKKITLKDESVLIAPRVSDWFRQAPRALQQPPYLNRLESENEESKFLHSYPIHVTRLMREYCTSEKRGDDTRFTCAGIIHNYGQGKEPIEGYFADCFGHKSAELYHHFFHKKPLNLLIANYAEGRSLFYGNDQQEIEEDREGFDDQNQTVDILEVAERFVITKKRYSIEVDDTQKLVRYTLCFPEGLR